MAQIEDHIVLAIVCAGVQAVAIAGIVFDNIRIRRIQKKRKAAEKKYRRNLKLAVNYAINDYYAEVGR